jgi:CRP/FNR family transcriptional regulator, cyclic AMP receptor protein
MKTEFPAPLVLTETIERHALFRGLPKHHISLLAEAAMMKEFAADELIFREGDPANRFYLILDGEVALESANAHRENVVVQTIGADDVLGWSWLFPPYYWHFGARATKPTKAIFFYGTWLRESCERSPEFGYEMMRRMANVMLQRLQATRRKLAAAPATL